MVVQVALTLVLLVGAGLFLRTLRNAYAVDLGYDVDRVLLTEVNLDLRGYSSDAGQLAYARILEAVGAIPGVTAVGAARVAVLSGSSRVTSVSLDGQPVASDGSNAIDVRTNVVSHGYLAALSIKVLRGRDFDVSDRAGEPRVALVSQSLAMRLWPSSDPIGQTLISAGPLTVIGVVPDVVYRTPIEAEPPGFFLSLLAQAYESAVRLHVRTVSDPMEMFPAVQRAVRQVDPLLALSPPARLRESLEEILGEQRLMARLVALFAALSLTLALVGLNGVLAYVVTERRGEIGVRIALGAQPGSIHRMILRQGLTMVVIGSAIGVFASLGLACSIESRLFGIAPWDPMTITSVCLVLIVTSAVACLVPARRATRVDPAEVLKAV